MNLNARFLMVVSVLGVLLGGAEKMVESQPIEPLEKVVEIQEAPTYDYAGIEFEIPDQGYQGHVVPEAVDDGIEYNGWHYGLNNKWIPGMPSFASQFMVAPDLFMGDVWPYGPGVMEGTAEYNGLSLDNVVDGVALMTCADHGGLVWLKRPRYEWEGPFKVVDCARRNDIYNTTVHRDEAVEVGFETAVRWGMSTKPELINGEWVQYWTQGIVHDVIVSKIPPDQLSGDEEIVDYSEWFLDRVTFDEFDTNQEAEKYYNTIPRMLYRPPVEKEGLPTWRIPPSGEFIGFDLTTMADIPIDIESIAGKVVVHTPTSVIKSFEVEPDEFWIDVDLSEQALYAYSGSEVINKFVISSGLFHTPTPPGSYEIYAMYLDYTMAGVDGSIPHVPFSMFFHGEYALHGTFWHNSFGEKMSRGCINLTVEDSEWIYERAEKGTHVYIHQ